MLQLNHVLGTGEKFQDVAKVPEVRVVDVRMHIQVCTCRNQILWRIHICVLKFMKYHAQTFHLFYAYIFK